MHSAKNLNTMYLVIALQHPLVILILRVLPSRKSGFLLPSVNAKVLRPIDALLPHLNEFRFSRLRSIFLLALRSHFRHFRFTFVTTGLVFVIVILTRLVFVFMILVRFLLAFVIMIVVVIVFVIGFMSVIVRVRELRAEQGSQVLSNLETGMYSLIYMMLFY